MSTGEIRFESKLKILKYFNTQSSVNLRVQKQQLFQTDAVKPLLLLLFLDFVWLTCVSVASRHAGGTRAEEPSQRVGERGGTRPAAQERHDERHLRRPGERRRSESCDRAARGPHMDPSPYVDESPGTWLFPVLN